MGASCYRMAECSLFAPVPTRCEADVEVDTSKASDGVSLASVYATKAVKLQVGVSEEVSGSVIGCVGSLAESVEHRLVYWGVILKKIYQL